MVTRIDNPKFKECPECSNIFHEGTLDGNRCNSCGSGGMFYVDTYECGDCGNRYHPKSEAVECEKSHQTPVKQ